MEILKSWADNFFLSCRGRSRFVKHFQTFFFSEKLDCSIGERSQAVYVEQERVGDYRGKLEAGNGSV